MLKDTFRVLPGHPNSNFKTLMMKETQKGDIYVKQLIIKLCHIVYPTCKIVPKSEYTRRYTLSPCVTPTVKSASTWP